jgi:hypothetical protein
LGCNFSHLHVLCLPHALCYPRHRTTRFFHFASSPMPQVTALTTLLSVPPHPSPVLLHGWAQALSPLTGPSLKRPGFLPLCPCAQTNL